MYEKVIKIVGKEKGETSMIMVGVHGNEICGVKAIQKILPSLKINKGTLFIAFGNPRAIKKNVRYTESNLNRMFKDKKYLSKEDLKSYEYKRAQFLKKYLDQTIALLDIHASYTPKSRPFIICESNANEIIKYLPTNLIVTGFDKVEPGGTDYYMNSIGKIGICFECGYLGDAKSDMRAEQSIFAFLSARGHIKNQAKIKKQSYIRMYKIYMAKTEKFTLSKKFKDFEKITKKQIIGLDGKRKIKATKNSIVLFARNTNKINEEAFLLGERKTGLA